MVAFRQPPAEYCRVEDRDPAPGNLLAAGYPAAAESLCRAPPPLPAWSAARRTEAALARTIETAILPRLVLARRAAAAPPRAAPAAADIAAFASLILRANTAEADGYLAQRQAAGATVEAICLDLLAPTARHLGELWEQERCHFTDVTIALGRLQRLMHAIGDSDGVLPPPWPGRQRRILLAPAPGDQHTFGLAMVAGFFRRAGWDVWCDPGWDADDLLSLVRRHRFLIVGFSLSNTRRLEALAAGIRAVRRFSLQQPVGIMVGGRMVAEMPELSTLVGADAGAANGAYAVRQARDLADLLVCPE
ncbi:MAG TPA: cobalamin B12-binding domain-containing protein [Acetobacteraceae bacterium]|nr:cobalamin B12-binding domain-containing protein [Acetobacteraceae bacterium]